MGRRAILFRLRCALLAYTLVCASLFFAEKANASPWTLPARELLVISRADYFNADLGPVNTLDGIVDSRFERLETNTYAEYGLTNRVMIGGKVVYGTSWLTRGATAETATGFSELEAFGQYQLFRNGRHAGAVRVAIARPSGFGSGARAALQSDGPDLQLSALYGRNLSDGPVKIFAVADAGLRKRFGDAADEARFQATLGAEPGGGFLLLLDSYATLSFRNEDPGGGDYDIVKIQPSVVWRLSRRWTFQAGVTEEVAGRNIDLGRTYFFGIWSRF